MSGQVSLVHEFVDLVPETLVEGVLYVSIPFATVVHKCCCGCGNEVVTPLGPTDWQLTYDGESISLSPSIGNWSFACQSHYWIKRNQVTWAPRWSQEQIAAGRSSDREAKAQQFASAPEQASAPPRRESVWQLLRTWLRR